VASDPVGVFVPGARQATLRLNVAHEILVAGDELRINLSVANSGEHTWADTARPEGDPADVRARTTRAVATWVLLDRPGDGEVSGDAAPDAATAPGDAAAVPLAIDLRELPLAPGALERIRETLVVPSEAGSWALVIDIVDDVAGSYAALGSAPAVALFEVVPPRGIAPVE
jgi:hypothetical protein